MATLYSYIVREDHGFAPNPYGGVLTLTCCKPDMRLQAQSGDYVAGISGADHPASRKLLLFAAKITARMTMTAYRDWAESECTDKIPGPVPPHRKLGDAMYVGPDLARDRRGYHDRSNRAEDVRGRYALLSRFPDFAYFGSRPVELPEHLRPITGVRRYYWSRKNDDYLPRFVEWFDSLQDRGLRHSPTLGPMAYQSVTVQNART